MAVNFLEQLIAEWYEYQGYFVRRNVLVGKRAKGGYECELDIVALNPQTKHVVHVEPSMDADSWIKRERRYLKKFNAGRKYLPQIFPGLASSTKVEQIAVLVFASRKKHGKVGGGRVDLASDLLSQIFQELKNKHLASNAIPENFVVLRSFQFVAEYRRVVFNTLMKSP